jgi:hypothetical protein
MPFVTPTLSDAFGSRFGTTAITGSLNPALVDGVVFNVGANIGAGPPFGAITTTNSWGFNAGPAPAGKTSLIVSANGMTLESAQTFTAGFGSTASADAELSITIEEFQRVRVPHAGGSLVRVRSFTSNRMPFIHIWSAAFGLQIHDRGPAPFAPVMLIPIRTGRFYRCWFNAIQSATCQAVTARQARAATSTSALSRRSLLSHESARRARTAAHEVDDVRGRRPPGRGSP